MSTETTTPPPSPQAEIAARGQEMLPEVESIPSALLWSIGGVAGMMLLTGAGVLLLHWWESLHIGVQVGCLLLPLVILWGGYGLAARRGLRSGEVVGAFAGISWLLLLLVWQTLCPGNPEWLPGVLFVGGTLGVAVFFPNRTSVVMLAVASVAEMGLLWYSGTGGGVLPAGVLLWAGGVALLCLWGLAGFLCGLTRHAVYAPYAFLGPLVFSIYLLALQGCIIYLPELPGAGWQSWLWVALLWMGPTALFCVVHRLLAARRGKPVFSLGFLAMLAAMYAVLPVGLWASQVLPLVPGVVLLFVYAVCMVRYGAAYRAPYFIAAGSGLVFLSAIGVAFGQGGSLPGGGITMLLLGAAFAWLGYHLYRRRRLLQMHVALLKKRRENAR